MYFTLQKKLKIVRRCLDYLRSSNPHFVKKCLKFFNPIKPGGGGGAQSARALFILR